MTLFQLLVLPLLGFMLLATVILWRRGSLSLRVALFLSVILIGGMVAVYSPDLTTRIAQALGIARGTNLLLYITVLAMLTGFTLQTLRINRVERQITLLVRSLAHEEVERDRKEDPS